MFFAGKPLFCVNCCLKPPLVVPFFCSCTFVPLSSAAVLLRLVWMYFCLLQLYLCTSLFCICTSQTCMVVPLLFSCTSQTCLDVPLSSAAVPLRPVWMYISLLHLYLSGSVEACLDVPLFCSACSLALDTHRCSEILHNCTSVDCFTNYTTAKCHIYIFGQLAVCTLLMYTTTQLYCTRMPHKTLQVQILQTQWTELSGCNKFHSH